MGYTLGTMRGKLRVREKWGEGVHPGPIIYPTKPEVSLPLRLILFYDSKKVLALMGPHDKEKQIFHFTDGETMSLRAFYTSGKSTRSW